MLLYNSTFNYMQILNVYLHVVLLFLDQEHFVVKQWTKNLKEQYTGSNRYVSKILWPPFTPSKFTELGFVIHKPKRTKAEAKNFARLKRSGSFTSASKHSCETFDKSSELTFDSNIVIKENISDIFLPAEKDLQIVLVEGAPGIGKTMLLKEIGYLWATEKLLSDKEVVLLLLLRDPNIMKIHTLDELFNYYCNTESNAKFCASYFCNNGGSGLVILVDGLDENPNAMDEGSLLYNMLISRKYFSKACIVITSRPHATVKIQMHVSYRVEIIGFTVQRRHEFVNENLEPGDAAGLKKYLESHIVIDTLCHIPLNLSILLFLYKEKLKKGDGFLLPTTQTELIRRAVEMTVTHNLERLGGQTVEKNDLQALPEPYQYIFRKFCRLAYTALDGNKLTFTSNEIRIACPFPNEWQTLYGINDATVISGLGLVQTAQFRAGIQGNIETLSNFVHFSVQELLAAWDVSFWYNYFFQVEKRLQWLPLCIQNYIGNCIYYFGQQRELNNKFWKGEYMNMWLLYIGLTEGKDKVFKRFLSGNCLVQQCKEFSVSKSILDNKIKTLLLYMCLLEAPENEIIEHLHVVVGNGCLDLSKEKLCQENVDLLGYILSRPYLTPQWKRVDLSNCDIDDYKFETLHSVITRPDGMHKPNIQDLVLCSNSLEFCGSAIAKVAQNQEIMNLNLSGNALKKLDDFNLCIHLEVLDMSNNNLTNKEAVELFLALRSLKNLRELKLNNNNINDDEDIVDRVGSSLCYCSDSLKKLEFDGNPIQNKAMIIFEVINYIKNSTSQKVSFHLATKARACIKIVYYCSEINSHPNDLIEKIAAVEVLDLSNNSLQDSDAEILSNSLHVLKSLKKLDITNNRITDASTKVLIKGILLSTKLKQFEYDESLFNEQSLIVFKIVFSLRDMPSAVFNYAPPNFNAFIVMLECVGELSEDFVRSSDIVIALGCVTELDLRHEGSGKKLNDENIRILCNFLRWFRKLEMVLLNNNDITKEVTESLVLTMLQIQSFKQVELAGNPIVDSELAVKIFTIILDIHEKELQSFTCDEDSDHQNCESFLFVMECLNKIKCPTDCILLNSIVALIIHPSNMKCAFSCKVVNYINFLPGLQCLDISGAHIADCGIDKLSTYLTNNHQLKELDLSNNDLKFLQIHDQAVNQNKKPLLVARFNNCNITDELLCNLIQSLVMFSDLDFFELDGNHIGSKAINIFWSQLAAVQNQLKPSTSIASLNLSNNQLDGSSAEDMLRIVKFCNVKALNVSCNHLDSFFYCLENSNVTTIEELMLEELDVSGNNKRENNSVKFLQNISCLSECKALKTLNISNNHIVETALDQIYCYFIKCFDESNLIEIQCICNENPASGKIEAAFDLVKNLFSFDGYVEVIDLKSCPKAANLLISVMASQLQHTEVTKEIVAINNHAAKIKCIDFSNCNLQIDERFAYVLCQLTCLEELNMSKNRIKGSTFKHLVTGFLFTRQLKLSNLHLKDNPCNRSEDNYSKLKMIDHIRSVTDCFKCLPKFFRIFLLILEHLGTINTKNCDVYDKITCLKSLDISSLGNEDLPLKEQKKLSTDDVQKLCNFLSHFKSLEVLNMKCNNITENAMDCLVISVLRNSSIDNIYLEGNPIYKIGKITTLFKTLKDVRKSHNEFDFKDLPEILQAFVELLRYINNFEDKSCDIVENIEHLSLKDFYQQKRHAQYSIEKARKIVTGFINKLNLFKKLRTFDLCSTHLDAFAIRELPGFLCSTNALETLDISENSIKTEGALWIFQQLRCLDPNSNRPHLSINMTANEITGDTACVQIAELICSLPTIISVDILKGNKFSDKAMKILKSRK